LPEGWKQAPTTSPSRILKPPKRKTIPFVTKGHEMAGMREMGAHDQRKNREPKMQQDFITRRLIGRSELIRHGTAHASSLLDQKLAFARELQRRTRFRLPVFNAAFILQVTYQRHFEIS
jgi:hypothetical protein